MRGTTPWLLLGSASALAIVLGVLVSTPAAAAELRSDWAALLALGTLPIASLWLCRTPRHRSATLTRDAMPGPRWATLTLGGLICVGTAAASSALWPSALGPITAVLAFGLIAALATLCSPARDRPLTSGTDSADPLVLPTASSATDAPRARAA